MSREIAASVADGIASLNRPVRVVWHGGEPLTCGLDHFKTLVDVFEDRCARYVTHAIQTNGTLIDDEWCRLFREYKFEVGVSVDGFEQHNIKRLDMAGRPSHRRVLRGIQFLRDHDIEFAIVSVVHQANLASAHRLYDFAVGCGASVLGVNVEETEGCHQSTLSPGENVTAFWVDLFEAWARNPAIQIREFTRMLGLMVPEAVLPPLPVGIFDTIDVFPSITVDGAITLLSPEFVDCGEQFIVGNIAETPLETLLMDANKFPLVADYVAGVAACRRTCEYFNVCGGGNASNKYFELGRVDGTETMFCRNSVKRVADAILSCVEKRG